MEHFESRAAPSVSRTCMQLTPSLHTASLDNRGGQQADSTNYLTALLPGQRKRGPDSPDNIVTWVMLADASHMLSDCERFFAARRPFTSGDDAPLHSKAESSEAHLQKLEESLDKLLSSFHSVVFAPADAVYSASLCIASSRTVTESISHVLALTSGLEAVNTSMTKLEGAICEGADFLADDGGIPSQCLQVSARLAALEKYLTTLEAEVAALKRACKEKNAAFDAISHAYAAMQSRCSH